MNFENSCDRCALVSLEFWAPLNLVLPFTHYDVEKPEKHSIKKIRNCIIHELDQLESNSLHFGPSSNSIFSESVTARLTSLVTPRRNQFGADILCILFHLTGVPAAVSTGK
jgi:hypothetical protein